MVSLRRRTAGKIWSAGRVRRPPRNQSRPQLTFLEDRCLPAGFAEFPIPTPDSNTLAMTAGPDGNIWFSESDGNQVGRIAPDGTITEFPVPTARSSPGAITLGPDGNLWFTEYGARPDQIGQITPDGTVTEFASPIVFFGTTDIATGADGNLWFTNLNRPLIGQLTPGGQFSSFPLPASLGNASRITLGPDGNLWFSTTYGLAEIAPDGTVTDFPFPAANRGNLTLGPDGNVWFSEPFQAGLGEVGLDGTFTEYPLGQATSISPGWLTTGPDGAVWFTDFSGRLGRLTLNGTLAEWPVPYGDAVPRGLAVGSDNNIWFADQGTNSIGRFVAPNCFLSVTPAFPQVPAGSTIDVTVQAVDAYDQPDPTYQGTIHFASTDPEAVLPDDYTFTAADQGVHTFTVPSLGSTAGVKTLTATDTADGTIRGESVVRVTGLPATQLGVHGPATVAPRTPFNLTVAAVDPYGNLDPTYAGTVTFSSTDLQAVLPHDYTFDPVRDHGAHTFSGVVLVTTGTQTISVQDVVNGLSGSTQVRVQGPGDRPGSGTRKDGLGVALAGGADLTGAARLFPAAVTASLPENAVVPAPAAGRGAERGLPQGVDPVTATAPADAALIREEGGPALDRTSSDIELLGLPILFEDETRPSARGD